MFCLPLEPIASHSVRLEPCDIASSLMRALYETQTKHGEYQC